MPNTPEDPSPEPSPATKNGNGHNNGLTKKAQQNGENSSFFSKILNFVRPKQDPSLRETIEEFIEEVPEDEEQDSISDQERFLLSNILKLRDMKVVSVMIPRADIEAIDVKTTEKQLLKLLADKQYSRIPVYRNTLDDVLGTVHIKDILGALARGEKIEIKELMNDTPIVSPSISVLDLLLEMRQSRRHMALVVDEYGGIDGLVTIGDIIEAIVGEIDDEHDIEEDPRIIAKDDGSYLADGRLDIYHFEEEFGPLLSDREREESDTLGGLVFFLAGRVPVRGEILTHESGMIFEVLDADPRRINILRIRNIPAHS